LQTTTRLPPSATTIDDTTSNGKDKANAKTLMRLPPELLVQIFGEVLGGDGYALCVDDACWRWTGEPYLWNKGPGFFERFGYLGGELSSYMVLSKGVYEIVREAFSSRNFFNLSKCHGSLKWLRGIHPAHLNHLRKAKIALRWWFDGPETADLIDFLQVHCKITTLVVTISCSKYWKGLRGFQQLPEVVALCRFRGLRVAKVIMDNGVGPPAMPEEKTWLEVALRQNQ
jgi:hypothetical protein